MTIVTMELPQKLAEMMRELEQITLGEILERGMRDWKIERALRRYAQGGMSFQAAAQQAGVSMADLAFHAYALGMEPPASEQTLAEECTCTRSSVHTASHEPSALVLIDDETAHDEAHRMGSTIKSIHYPSRLHAFA